MKWSEIVLNQAQEWIQEIRDMDIEHLARANGFQKRSQRKIPLRDLTLGVLACVAASRLSFERVAASIGLRARQHYSKQALHKRLGPSVSTFLLAVFSRCLKPTIQEAVGSGLLAPFRRVLLHDSTTIALPPCYAQQFPGSTNQHKAGSLLKTQVVCNLLNSKVEQLNLSGFTRNDQAASPDILDILQPGDLVLRDLGYFVLSVFASIIKRGAFFLSRYRHGTVVLDPATGQRISLPKVLKRQGRFDAIVWLGESTKLPVRLVAVPVPDAVANQRRRQLRQNRDAACNPGKEHFYLMGWSIFVTNVPSQLWPASQFPILYRLRWRIETLFKGWKSYLRLTELNTRSLAMIHLSVMTKLIFCAFVYRTCQHIELVTAHTGRQVSFLRVANLLSSLSLCLEATFVNLTPLDLLSRLLNQHAFYERRRTRRNFIDTLQDVMAPA